MTLETMWLEIGGFTIRAPITAGMNLALAVQCGLYFRSLRTTPGARARLWSGFFFMMAIATFAGVFKHGFRHELPATGLFLVLWVSSLASGISTFYAQRGTAATFAPEHVQHRFRQLFQVQLFLFLAANFVLGPEMLLIGVNTAVGLAPVAVVEAMALRQGRGGSAWMVGGISFAVAPAVAYAFKLSLGPWLNHIDIAHVLMGVSFWLIVRGCRPPVSAPREYEVAASAAL